MNELPNPLTPADCDLQDFGYMPLDVVRLRDSDLAARSTGEEFRCAVLLWCAAWHQVPAGSLPDDDVNLAQYAGFGRAVDEWRGHREGALRGWIKCADGRLYHRVVAEKVITAWQEKHKRSYEKLVDRIRKRNKVRAENNLHPLELPPLEDWIDAGRPSERILFPTEFRSTSAGSTPEFPPENALKGKGTEGRGKGIDKTSGSVIASGASARAARDDDPTVPKSHADWCRYFAEEHGVELDATNVHHRNKAWPLFTAWIKAGVSIGQMDRACAKARAESKGAIAFLPAYADTVLASMDRPAAPPREDAAERRARISKANGDAWLAESPESDPNVIDMEH